MKILNKKGLATYLILAGLAVISILMIISFVFDLIPNPDIKGVLKLSVGMGNFPLQIILSIIYGFLFIAINYFLFIGTYLKLRKRFPKSKYAVEIGVFLVAFAINIAIKIIIFSSVENPVNDPSGFINNLAIFYRAIYMSIGGVQFEGLMDLPEGILLTAQILYFGSSIIFGLVAITLITFKAAYEVYSFFQFKFFFRNHIFSNYNRDIFVFTDLNDQTFFIADSIQKKYETEKNNFMIIFTGPRLEPFDRKNAFCSEAMGRGFLYWSYSQNDKTNVPAVLGLKKRKNDPTNKFFVFAFDIDEDGKPLEEQNAQFVIDEINHRVDRLYITYVIYARKNIHYRAYEQLFKETKEEHKPLDLSNCKTREEIKQEKIRYKYRDKSKSDVIVWSEPNGIADQVATIVKTNYMLGDTVPSEKDTYVWLIGCGRTGEAISKSLFVNSANIDNMGRSAKFTCAVFDREASKKVSIVQKDIPASICVDRDEVIEEMIKAKEGSKFVEDDSKLERTADDDIEFPFEDKLFHKGGKETSIYACSSVKEAIKQEIIMKKENLIAGARRKLLDTQITRKISEDTIDHEFARFASFPVYVALNVEFFKANFHKEARDVSLKEPNYIVVSSGDDMRNVEIVNSLVTYYRKNRFLDSRARMTIFVVIYNRKNNFFISDYDRSIKGDDRKIILHLNGQLKVVIIGNREDTFKYEKIVFEDKAIDVNYRYTKLYNKLSVDYGTKLQEKVKQFNNLLINANDEQKDSIKKVYDKLSQEQAEYTKFQNTFGQGVSSIENEFKSYLIDASFNNDKEAISGLVGPKDFGFDVDDSEEKSLGISSWRSQTLWKKSSSHGAYVYFPTYSFFLYEDLKDSQIKGGEWKIDKEKLLHLAEIEHLRWVRFHYADGWTYDPENDNMDRAERERFKYHKALLPYSLINQVTYRFDIANVLYAIQSTFDEVREYKKNNPDKEDEE